MTAIEQQRVKNIERNLAVMTEKFNSAQIRCNELEADNRRLIAASDPSRCDELAKELRRAEKKIDAIQCPPNSPASLRKDTGEKIFAFIKNTFGVDEQTLVSRNRHGHIAFARSICCYLLYYSAGNNSVKTGKILCRDHTSVLHLLRVVENGIKNSDPKICEAINQYNNL